MEDQLFFEVLWATISLSSVHLGRIIRRSNFPVEEIKVNRSAPFVIVIRDMSGSQPASFPEFFPVEIE